MRRKDFVNTLSRLPGKRNGKGCEQKTILFWEISPNGQMVQTEVFYRPQALLQRGLDLRFTPREAIVEQGVVVDDIVGAQVVHLPGVGQQMMQQRRARAMAAHDEHER